jgi:hypothetical protein
VIDISVTRIIGIITRDRQGFGFFKEKQMANNGWSDLISKRIEQHITSLNLLENIRWRFITSFGIGAFIAFLASTSGLKEGNRIVTAILVIIVSVAGIISQIRIFGMMINLWNKIRNLQQEEVEITSKNNEPPENLEILKNLYLPEVENKRGPKYLFTVHMASCVVFSTLIGVAAYLLANMEPTTFCFPSAGIGISVLAICSGISYWASKEYVKSFGWKGDRPVNTDNPVEPEQNA